MCCTGRVCCASIAEVCVSLFFFLFRPLKVNHFVWLRDLSSFKHFPPLPPFFFLVSHPSLLIWLHVIMQPPSPPLFFLNSYYYFLVRVPTGEFRDGVNERKGGKGMSLSIPVNSYANFPWIFALLPILRMTQFVGSCVIRSSLSLQWAKQSLFGVGCFSQVWLSQRSDDWTSTCWPSCQQVSSSLLL